MPTQAEQLMKLQSLMTEHKLTATDVARITLRQPSTVRCWLAGIRNVPASAVRLMELECSRKVTA